MGNRALFKYYGALNWEIERSINITVWCFKLGNQALYYYICADQVGAVEGEEEGRRADDEEQSEVEDTCLPGHDHPAAAVVLVLARQHLPLPLRLPPTRPPPARPPGAGAGPGRGLRHLARAPAAGGGRIQKAGLGRRGGGGGGRTRFGRRVLSRTLAHSSHPTLGDR